MDTRKINSPLSFLFLDLIEMRNKAKLLAVTLALTWVIALSSTSFSQGTLERGVPDTRALFQDGNYFEMAWAADASHK